jgi:hypothetical protein
MLECSTSGDGVQLLLQMGLSAIIAVSHLPKGMPACLVRLARERCRTPA